MRKIVAFCSILSVLAILGCGSDSSTPDTTSSYLGVDEGLHARGGRAEYNVALVASDAVAPTLGSAASPADRGPGSARPRMVIKAADLRCEVADYDSTFAEIQRLTEHAGGYIVSSTVQHQDEDAQAGSLILRIPSDVFDPTLTALKALATSIDTESIRGNDVTEEFYDLSARLDNKRKAEKRFQEILRSAKTSTEILEVEQALANVREEIERMEGRKRFLADQADLSTISMFMHEPRPLIATGTTKLGTRLKSAFGTGLERGVLRFVNLLTVFIAFFITAAPFVLAAFVLFWFGRKHYRRARPAAAVSNPEERAP